MIIFLRYFAFFYAKLSCKSNPSEFQANVSCDPTSKIENETFKHELVFVWIFGHIFHLFHAELR